MNLTGGRKLQAALNEILRKVNNAKSVDVGFLSGATYPDGTPVAMVAAIQNYGAPGAGIPARPFFTNMVASKSPGWGVSLGKVLKENGYDARKSMDLMGTGIKGQLQAQIRADNPPPNAPATVKRKGFDHTLIDTGHMLNSVDYEVKG